MSSYLPRFDLDKSLSVWRRTLEYKRAFSVEDMQEILRFLTAP
jgi:hypothetical protein